MALKIGICDDLQIDIDNARAIIENFLEQKKANYTIIEYTTKDQLLQEAKPLDVLFLDIDLGDTNGIDVATTLINKWPHCKIVFFSGYVDFVSDVYAARHVYFVLKDYLEKHIDRIFDAIIRDYEAEHQRIVFDIPHHNTLSLTPQSIVYIERNARKSIIHTRKKTYEVVDKISVLMEKMKKYDFARCHNSFIVSLPDVSEVHADHVILLESIEIPISRFYKQSFREEFLQYSARQLP